MRTIQTTLLSLLIVFTLATSALAQVADPIDSGETILNQYLGTAGQNLYEFSGSLDDMVVALQARTSGNLQCGLELYGPGVGDPPVFPFLLRDCRDAPFALLWHQLPDDGTYRINAVDCYGNWGDTTGGYNITLMKQPGSLSSLVDPNGGFIQSGETKTGNLNVKGDLDAFEFAGSAGDRAIILLARTSTSDTLQCGLQLFGPDNIRKTYECRNAPFAVLLPELPLDGTYRVIVGDCYGNWGDTTGGYNITLMKQPGSLSSLADPNGGSIQSGETKTGNLNKKGDMDGFEFAGCTGETVTIVKTRTSGNLQAGLQLFGPDNIRKTLHCPNAPSATIPAFTLPLDGTYRVIAGDCYGNWGDTTGGYSISLTKVPAAPSCCDEDADGYDSVACGGDDCVDSNPSIHPGVAAEQCDNGTDDECDGPVDHADPDCPCLDNDDDDYGNPTNSNCIYSGLDCNDYIAEVNPGAEEIPGNSVDDDCNPSTLDYPAAANTIAASYGRTSLIGSGVFNSLALVLMPVGAVVALRILRRKR